MKKDIRKNSISYHTLKTLYRGVSILLVVTLLPFASFTGIGLHKVEASPMTNHTMENPISNNDVEPQSMEDTEDIQTADKAVEPIVTHGGEDIDAFVNMAMDGTVPEEMEDIIVAEDYMLEEDMRVRNLTVESGVLDLNGYTLYIYENLLQTGGELHINGGRVVVMGDYRIQSVAETEVETSEEYVASTGGLYMDDEADYLLVMGDFYNDPACNHYRNLTNGIMEVKGDFSHYATVENAYNFNSAENFHLYLTGTTGQTLEMPDKESNMYAIANLVIENESEEGITLVHMPYVRNKIITNGANISGCIAIGSSTVFEEEYFSGGIYVLEGTNNKTALTIEEDLIVSRGSFYLTESLTVKGNAHIDNVLMAVGGTLTVEGNVTIGETAGDITCGIGMTQEDSYVLVKGNYYQKATNVPPMVMGILEVQGHVTLDGTFSSANTHKVVLSGSSLQQIYVCNGAAFHIIELQNTGEAGVVMENGVTWKKLIKNGCKLSLDDGTGYLGYTLDADEEINEEFVLIDGVLDLNGHTLTVKSDFLHSGGTIVLNGGTLIVEGDYRRQTRIKNADGTYLYDKTDAGIEMVNENDHFLIKGDFMDGSSGDNDNMDAGCIELKGDLYQDDNAGVYKWNYPIGNCLLISGEEKQILHFTSDEGSRNELANLRITNTSDEGVVIEGEVWVSGRCESERDSRIEGMVYKGYSAESWGTYYAGDMAMPDSLTLSESYELGGDLYLQNTLYVNADMTVHGNVSMSDHNKHQTSGLIRVKSSNFIVKGSVEGTVTYYYPGIEFQSADAYALIEGDYRLLTAKQGYGYSYYGTLEVKGDIDIRTPFLHNGTLILSGENEQSISLGSKVELNEIEVTNNSAEGICLENFVCADSWELNENIVTYKGDRCVIGETLQEDTIIDGNLVLIGGVLDLNGYHLQINGDLIQMAGDVRISGGRLDIKADYLLGEPPKSDETYNTATCGMLYMDEETDYVCVEGNFYENKTKGYYIWLTKGTLEVKSDFTFDAYFYTQDNHILLLSGEESQTVTYQSENNRYSGELGNLSLQNTSKEGITFINCPPVTGTISQKEDMPITGSIKITSMAQLQNGFYGGSIYYTGSNMNTTENIHVGGDLEIDSSWTLSIAQQVNVDGNLKITSPVKLNHGQLLVGNNLTLQDTVTMEYEDDYILVEGNLINEVESNGKMSNGVLEVRGDYTEKMPVTYGANHKILFSGNQKQTIIQTGKFHILELNNHSEDGIFTEVALRYDELIQNECKLVIGDESGVIGFTLEDDYIVSGDLYLVDGVMDLNGKTLVIQGDLILQEGSIKVNHGNLIVEGDFRYQKRKQTDEEYEYSVSRGSLCLDYEDDHMRVDGNCILMPSYIAQNCTKGTLECNGNLENAKGNLFQWDGTLILNGKEKQSLSSHGEMQFANLIVTNQSSEGVALESDIYISECVSDLDCQVNGSGTVRINDFKVLEEGYFGGNLLFKGYGKLNQDVYVQGNLDIQGELSLNGKQLYVEQKLTVMDTGIVNMENPADYMLVGGDMTYESVYRSTLTAGTMELKGDFTQSGTGATFVATGEHQTILSGAVTEQGEHSVQNIHMETPGSNRFHTLVLKKELHTCYQFDTVPEDIADEVIYELYTEMYPRPVTEILKGNVTPFSVEILFDGTWYEGEIAGFRIYRDGVYIGATGTYQYKDTGLEPGKTYTYTVYPYNESQNQATDSPQIQIQTATDVEAPQKVQGLKVSERTGSAVTLVWDKGKDNVGVEIYRLYRDDTLIYEGSNNSYKDNGLDGKTLYQYYVIAVDGSGNVSEKSDTIDGLVFVPRILSVSPSDYATIGGESVELEVVFSGEGKSEGHAIEFQYYDRTTRTWKNITRTPMGESKNTDGTLYAKYQWRIANFGIEDEVDIRAIVTDTDGNRTEKIVTYEVDKEAPLPPENVEAIDQGGTVVVNWDNGGSADCTGYRIYRVIPANGSGGLIAEIDGKDSTWYEDTLVEVGETYNYYVRAYDQFDQLGAMSNVAEVTVQPDNRAPKVVSMTPDSGTVNRNVKITVEGSDNKVVKGFKLYIQKSGEDTWTFLTELEAEKDMVTYSWDTTVYPDAEYFIKAVAYDATGNESEELFRRRYEIDNTGIGKITLSECEAGITTVYLTWENASEDDFDHFLVETFMNERWITKQEVKDTLGCQIYNLKPLTTYRYRVRGVDRLGNIGEPSDEIVLTTLADEIAPYIKLIEPVSSYYNETIPLCMTVKDNAAIDYGVFSYSFDKENYVELATVYGIGAREEKLAYTWDVSALEEGDVYIRFEVYDAVGHHNALYQNKQIEYLYKIDHTPPGKPSGVTVTGEEGAVKLVWDKPEETDIASYKVYRAKQGQNLFRCVAEEVKAYGYVDTDVEENTTYIYRIAAVDIAGMEGEQSEKVYGSVKADETAPVVTGISPAESILGKDVEFEVLALDNARLQSVCLEYRKIDSDEAWTEIAYLETDEKEYYQSIPFDAGILEEGSVYEVRAKAIDAAGNESEYVTRTYTFDLTAPVAPQLQTDSGSFRIELSYTENTESDFECYRIYRRRYGEEEYTCIQSLNETTYTDIVEDTETVYYYKVRAYDIYGNYSESNIDTNHGNYVDDIAPVAELPETVGGIVGEEVAFDGVLSSDNIRINQYVWDFGDGTTAEGIRPVHVYETAGNYTVSLTVRDAKGNQATTNSVVEVADKSDSGKIRLRVTSNYGVGISGAYVYVRGKGEENAKQLRCDSQGYVTIVGNEGDYEIAAYASGFLPSEVSAHITNGGTTNSSIALSTGEIVTGEIKVEPMSLEEMLAEGIDLSAPSNYHTFRFEVVLGFSEDGIPDSYEGYGGPDEIVELPIDDDDYTVYVAFPEREKGENNHISPTGKPIETPVVLYLRTTQSVSWLKDMYNVEIGVTNHADSEYVMEDASAMIQLPTGLDLASTYSGQTHINEMGRILGQDKAYTSWMVSASESGIYEINAQFHGVLSPFGAVISKQFKTEKEFKVQAGEGLHIYVYPEDVYYPGEKYYIHFEVANESERPFYNVKTSMGEFEQPEQVVEWTVKDWETKEILEYQRLEGESYYITDPEQKAVPVLTNGAYLECGILPPGASVFGTYCTIADGEEDKCYNYVESFVNVLEGENLGVQVTVLPISSHIAKAMAFLDQKTGTTYGDPVDLTSGAFLYDLAGMPVNGATELSLGMHYNSMVTDIKGQCGYGWSHDYEQHIEDRGSVIHLYLSPYAAIPFISEEAAEHVVYGKVEEGKLVIDKDAVYSGRFYPASEAFDGWYINKTNDGYEVFSKDNFNYQFDAEGRLTAIRSLDNKSVQISYGDNKTTITDTISGEQLHLHYNEEGMLVQISDNHGRSNQLTYSGEDLISFTEADGKVTRFHYDGCHRILTVTDANNIVSVENEYDDKDRVIRQREAGIAGTAYYSYESLGNGGVKTTVQNYSGETISVETNANGDKVKETDGNGAVTSYTYNEAGNLLSKTDAKGNTETYGYDENGNQVSVTGRNGNTSTVSYDENGNVTTLQQGEENQTNFVYDDQERIIYATDSLGAVTRYAYDADGNAIRQVNDGLGVIAMTYENGRLTSMTDYNGNVTTFGYDSYGNRNSQTDALGRTSTIIYDAAGKITSETTADGTTITYNYDAKGQKIKETIKGSDGISRTTTYGYDAAGRVINQTNESGTLTYSYDSEGNMTSITYPDKTKDTFVYDAASNLIQMTTAGGVTTEYTVNALGNVLTEKTGDTVISYTYTGDEQISSITQADGTTISFVYDANGNCIKETDSEGNSYSYTYDATGNKTSDTDPLGNQTTYTYDTYGRCIKITDPNGNSTTYTYDGNSNCISATDAAGTTTVFTYDAANRMITSTTETSEGEYTISYGYDNADRVTSITDEMGHTMMAEYDSLGNLTAITDAKGSVVESNTYNEKGYLTKTKDALGNTTAYSYDTMGNIIAIIECLNTEAETKTSYGYDADGKLMSVSDAVGTTSLTYDNNGNVTSMTDAMEGTTTYSYDSMNRVTEIVNAIGAKETYQYNARGLLEESVDNAGEKTVYTYDAAGRIIKQKDELGTIRYSYDKNGNVLTVSDKNGTIERTYDVLNRVTSVTDYNGDTISYAYDELGNRISITYPGGEKVRYTYDKSGRMLTVTDIQGKVTYYSYDENGQLIETVRGDGSKEIRTYNVAGQLATLRDETSAGEVIHEYQYSYDAAGNIIKITGMDTGISEGAKTSIADLTDENPNDGITPAVQNADGSIMVAVSMTYDADNRLLTYNGQTVEYDKVGNMTRGPLNGAMADFTYDCRNRLIKVKEADGTITEYEYDAENIRTAVIANGIRTEYTTDRESTYSQILVKTEYEKNTLGFYTEEKSKTTYIYGLGLISERRDDNQEYYYHYNHIGSTTAVSDANGNILFRFVYDTYGELSDITTDGGVSLKSSEQLTEYRLAELANAIGIDYLYNGQYGVETDTNGLYYMRARYYNQDIKRFINRDVVSGDITNSQSLNRYCYVQGNPVSLIDPFGLCPTEEERRSIKFKRALSNIVHTTLDAVGLLVPGMGDMLDAVNAIIYAMEGNIDMAIISLICTIPIVGSLIGLPIKYAMKYGVDVGMAFMKFGIRNAPEITEGVSRLARAMKSKYDDASAWVSKKFAKFIPDSGAIPKSATDEIPIPSAGGKQVAVPKYDIDTINVPKAGGGDITIPKGGGCFVAGTQIKTREGSKGIEEIEVGDFVYAKDTETGEVCCKKVVQVFIRESTELVHLQVGEASIDTTVEHPFWVVGYGFKPAEDLKAGDYVETADGEQLLVTNVEKETLAEPVPVYNFEVEDWHTYYVSEEKVLVHNNGCMESSGTGRSNPWDIYTKQIFNNSIDVSGWNKGSFDSVEESVARHYYIHASEVGASSIEQYIRKAEGFKINLRGATKSYVDGAVGGVIRYKKAGRYIDLAPDGTIISFGAS